ncbi:MAG: phenylalanine--tRNA ligase subunit beta [bacterium]|nr:phenylalanine--tRNA ligase subunit beta [bacterium]
MNIFVPDSWLRDFIKTKATPKQIAADLSLCSQSVERTTKTGDDFIYEIEVTTNRPDCLSVYGLARELSAILPRFKTTSRLQPLLITDNQLPVTQRPLPLNVKITNPLLCPRFTALIFDNIKIKPSPKVVQDRLTKSGIRTLNNVIDISNYLMLELGQPMHTFDYDKIKGATMILRESKEGEKLVTLDGQIRSLPKGTTVIEDGDGRLIDLCGIMGAKNSAVDEKTTRVLLFVQTYNPARIRRTCQSMGFRTQAASYFEKGVDPEGVVDGIKRAILMFEKNCEAKIASNLIDIYHQKPQPKTVKLSEEKLNEILGINISLGDAKKILESLGFKTKIAGHNLVSRVPHWRMGDVTIPEDLIEEIARLYGYHNLPTNLPTGRIPQSGKNEIFDWIQRIKNTLKGWGFTEAYNYSFISENYLRNLKLLPENYLKLSNPLTEDWVYLRPSLIPSLTQNVAINQDLLEKVSVFEIANTYLPKGKTQLPNEVLTLSAIINYGSFYHIKGFSEALLEELGINSFQFIPLKSDDDLTSKGFLVSQSARIIANKEFVGTIGQVDPKLGQSQGVKNSLFAINLDFNILIKNANKVKKYNPVLKYPAIIEDLSFVVPGQVPLANVLNTIKGVNALVKDIKLIDSYQNTRTLQISYQNPERNLTKEEVAEIRSKIIVEVERKFGAKLKTGK